MMGKEEEKKGKKEEEGKKDKKGIMISELAERKEIEMWTEKAGISFTLITFVMAFAERKTFSHLLFLFLLPLFLLPISFSQVEHPEQILINVTDVSKTEVVKGLTSESLINDLLNNWQKWAFFGVMISFVYSIILYMGSKALDSPSLAAQSRIEFYEAAASFFILVSVLAVIAAINSFLTYCPESATIQINCFVKRDLDALERAVSGIHSIYFNTAKAISNTLVAAGKTDSFGFDLALVGFPETTISSGLPEAMALIPVHRKVMQHIQNLYLFGNSVLIAFKNFLLPLSVIALFAGVFLRSFFITRRLGATLIALGFAGYVIFPVTLHYIFTLAGFIEPSAPYAPTPGCPAACSNPVPKVVKAVGGNMQYVDTSEFLAERIRQLSPDTNPFEDDDFKKRYDLVFGKISSYSTGGATYYSCDNLADWGSGLSEGKCPAFCRVLPYPSDDASCREHEYWCEKLRVASNGACFNKLFYDPNDERTKSIIEDVNFQKQRVPVLVYRTIPGTGGNPPQTILDVEQKHPLTAAVENKCGYLVPQKVPPNIKLINYSSDGGDGGEGSTLCEKLVTPGQDLDPQDIDPKELQKCLEAGAQQATTTGTRHPDKFCPTIYRTVTYDPNTRQFNYPNRSFGGCNDFYGAAVDENSVRNALNAMFNCPSNDLGCIARNASLATQNLRTYVIINGDCNKIAAVPSEALWLPPTVDCSKCMKIGFTQIQASLKASRQEIQQIANLYIKIMLCPIIALALTGVIFPGLSNFLGGELFIPALDKIL